ncbi:GDSL-type esterase/lipase family protein [Nocardia jiangxiensis]|uniref:GDSL-type esterase/lipase family protein n=1 Tax=Nocardia jiangxiensis TaxID=282685 RepID=A0ABW6S8R7_9NOCA
MICTTCATVNNSRRSRRQWGISLLAAVFVSQLTVTRKERPRVRTLMQHIRIVWQIVCTRPQSRCRWLTRASEATPYIDIDEGGNDLRYCNRSATDVESGVCRLIDAAHAAGLKVVVGTYILRVSRTVVFADAMPDSASDDQRQLLNAWIRCLHDVTIVDFEKALSEPDRPKQRSVTGSLGGIHPGPARYDLMAQAVPLRELTH